MKELYREKDVVGNIAAIKFGFFSSSEMEQASHVRIKDSSLYRADEPGVPHPSGVLCRQLGTSQKDGSCTTCGKTIEGCPGHFGYIDLNLPVYHWGYFKNVVQIMQNICKTCSRVLLKPEVIAKYAELAMRTKHDYLKKKATVKRVNELCKKAKVCPHCSRLNGVIKKLAPMKITHERFRGVKKDDIRRQQYMRNYDALLEACPELASQIPTNPVEVYYPNDVLKLFRNIDPLDLSVLCMDQHMAHPKDLILTRLLVAPNCVRPSVVSDLKKPGTNEDDITSVMSWIVLVNNVLAKRLAVARLSSVHEIWEMLQIAVALLINADVPVPPEYSVIHKLSTCYVQRLKGKQGRFRGNLSGKRVDFSSRTVISPDPNLKINQVGVPEEVAKTLTYPERVTEHNLPLMRQLVLHGPDIHPGAVYLEQKSTPGIKKSIRHLWKKRHLIAQNLREGDIVERHLMDGDTVLFNRQPSLHKMSIMAHRAKVLPWRTFRFNECVCGPYNADFDGDEMNLHLPQTEEARAEATILMGVTNNLVTPRSGALIIGATQDFLTGSYLLTKKDKFFDRASACRLLMVIAEPGVVIQLPPPAIMKPAMLWTGKQLFSLVLRSNAANPVRVNLVVECPCKDCRAPRTEMCYGDRFIHVRNSELLSGVLDKNLLGAGCKKNVFYTILKDYGKEEAAEAMWRVARISIQFLMMYGFSIGIGDLMPSPSLLKMKQGLLDKGYENCNKYIEQLKNGQLECAPGCNAEESLEQVILSELSKIRDSAGRDCIEELNRDNSALVMAVSGSKGSNINISQMIACVGQQAISGKRVPDGFTNRSLPYFKHHSKLPEAKGFVSNSFFSGLTPSEFLFHTMGGREGLVDTAVKTAETGYMQRRLVKCLEDLYVAYDGTVRNCTQDVIQFKYGDDGLDPTHIETMPKDGKRVPPLDFERILYHVKAVVPATEDEPPMWGRGEGVVREEEQNDGEDDDQDDESDQEDEDDGADEDVGGAQIVRWTKDYVAELLKIKTFSKVPKLFIKSIYRFMKKESIKMRNAELLEAKMNTRDGVHLRRFTLSQLMAFIYTLFRRYVGSNEICSSVDPYSKLEAGPGIVLEPGTGVGALCAQSIGEPATQMTLKTFHFAGVAAMNITLGVPRIKEIINATRNISTPIITAQLDNNTDPHVARQVKARIEKTLLGEICEFIKVVSTPEDTLFVVRLSADHIKLLQLQVSAPAVKYAICTSKMKVRESDVTVESATILTIRPNCSSKEDPYHQMNTILKQLPHVVVKGLPSINRAVIHQKEKKSAGGPAEYELLVEGDNLREVLGTYGVCAKNSKSNNILEVQNTLGIEAARQTIINEITHTMNSHGLRVDCRHVNLLADLMTCRGAVHGITRHGLAKINESVLTLASFEKTADHLFEAAYHGQVNEINGVSDCIIMGKPINLGTGLFKLVQQHKRTDGPHLHRLSMDDEQSMDGQHAPLDDHPQTSMDVSQEALNHTEAAIEGALPAAAPPAYTRRRMLFDIPEFHVPLYPTTARSVHR